MPGSGTGVPPELVEVEVSVPAPEAEVIFPAPLIDW
jgi:hypothetical protein